MKKRSTPTMLSFLQDKFNWFTQVKYVTLNLFLKTEMQNHAAAVAYYFLLSVMPLILLIIFMFNSLLMDYPELHDRFFSMITFMDKFLNINPLKNINSSSGMGQITGGVSVLALLWSSMGLMDAIQSSFRVIFSDGDKRSVVSSGAISLLIVPIASLLISLVICGDFITDHLDYYLPENPVLADSLVASFYFAKALIPMLFMWYVIFSVYYRLPAKKPQLVATLISSGLCVLSIIALHHFFIEGLEIDKYNKIYGSVGSIIFVLICVYFIFAIFLLWAEFLYVAGKIDVIALEKIFLEGGEKGGFGTKIEHFLFKRSARIFEKYGRHFSQDEIITRQGDDSKTIYFLYMGKTGLYREVDGHKMRLASLKRGEIFGEMAYFLNEKRTATVIAESDCFLFTLSPQTLEALMSDSATLSRRIIASLCQRIYNNTHPRTATPAGTEEETEPVPVAEPA